MRLTPKNLEILKENINRISNEDKRRLSPFRKTEILGYLNIKKRAIDSWITKLLELDSRILIDSSDSLQSSIKSPHTPMWNLYNTLNNLSISCSTEIDSYTYWVQGNVPLKSISSNVSNALSNAIENRVLLKGANNPYYTHLEALSEIAEEEGIELSNIKASLSKSILQKIEAIGISQKKLKGSSARLPF
jgi:hypothetical protein